MEFLRIYSPQQGYFFHDSGIFNLTSKPLFFLVKFRPLVGHNFSTGEKKQCQVKASDHMGWGS